MVDDRAPTRPAQSANGPSASAAAALRVLSISHSAVRAGSSRMRYEALTGDPGLDLTLMIPAVWHEAGRPEYAEASRTALQVCIEKARLTRGGPAKWYLHHYPGLRAMLLRLRPDVIHLWEEPWSIVALQALRLRDKYLPQSAFLVETDQNIFRRLPPGFEQIRRTTLARTDLLIARSEEALDVSRRSGFTGAAELVEYAIDSATFYPRGRAADAADASRALRIGYVGRLVVEKGIDDVIEALHRCPTKVEFQILGAGPEKAALVARAAALGLADRVTFLEPRERDGVASFISSLDALVLMSRTTRTWKEQFGRVIIEAHACGVPVIGSSSGAIPMVIGHGGWVVPEGDVAALAALLAELSVAPEQAAATGELGRLEANGRFSQAAVSSALRRAWLRAADIRVGRAA